MSQPLSLEYLTSFHDLVKAHPQIYKHVLDEVHLKARGTAGGKKRWSQLTEEEAAALIESGDDPGILEEPEKQNNARFSNAAPTGKILNETDDIIDVEVFPIREGVFTGTDNIPTLKKYEEFAPYVHWLDGAPITEGHIYPEQREVSHVTPKPGKLLNTTLDPENRRARSAGRYFKKSISSDKLQRLQNGIPKDGSIEYVCGFDNTPGEFQGKHYDRMEVGPYYFYNYAEVPRGACSVSDGCGIQANAKGETGGPFQNAKGKKKDEIEELLKAPPSLELDQNGNVRRRDCKKQKNEADQMTEDIETLKAEFTKQLNAAKEIITGQAGAIEALTTKLDGLVGEHKTLNEAFQGKVTAEVAANQAAHKETFKKTLNAAASTEVDTLWDQVKSLGPMEFESWKLTNSGKLLTEAEKKQTTGKKMTDAAGDQVEAARAKANETLFKRRN